MAKSCSSIKGFVPAYGTILVIPEIRSKETAMVTLQVGDQSLPRGRVIAIGEVPRRYRKVPIGIGSLIAYSKVVTQSVPVDIDGVETKVMSVMWSDYRACWVDENNSNESSIRIRDILAFGAGFASGIAFSYRRYWLPFAGFAARVVSVFRKRKPGVVPGESDEIRSEVRGTGSYGPDGVWRPGEY